MKIECPKCTWKPDSSSKWVCHCGHTWNTFDTAARCPACQFQHKMTQCLSWSCHKISPYLDWYPELDEHLEELLKELANQTIEISSDELN